MSEEDVLYVVDFKEAREAADYFAILQDLAFVTDICDYLEDRLLSEPGSFEEDRPSISGTLIDTEGYVNRSLFTTALVTYGRCFLKGVRYSLPESIFTHTPPMDYTDLHRYFMNIRSKHVAHSVNQLEATDTCVYLDRLPDGSLQVRDITNAHLTLANLDAPQVQQLGSLAGYAYGPAQEMYEDAIKSALKKARSLSQEDLRSLRPHEFVASHDWQDVGKPRPGGYRRRR